MTKDVISLSILVLLLLWHYISHKITFGAPSSGGVLCSACGAFIFHLIFFIPVGYQDIHKSMDEFEFRSDPITDYRVSCPIVSENYTFTRFPMQFLFRSF